MSGSTAAGSKLESTLTYADPASVGAGPRRAVPWASVLTLALVLGYADGFWTTSLHDAVGDISRIQEPFTAYWRTSTLALPVFVLAVLAALTVALRRYGPELRSGRALVATGLLVAVAATLAAAVLSAGSAAYDYYLQSSQLGMMQWMQHDCNADCLYREQWMTIGAHARAVAYTGIAVLVTNIVLVAWVVALHGGRLKVSGRGHPGSARAAGLAGSRAQDLHLLMVVALVGSAAVHAAVVPEHLHAWGAAGVFFIVLTVAELRIAAGLAQPGRALLAAAVGVSVVPLVVWGMSRTTGLPFGPRAGSAEPVGLADCVACVLELGTLVAALLLLRGTRAVQQPMPAHHRALAVLALVVVGAVGIAGAAPAWFDGATDSPVSISPAVLEHHH